MKRLDVTQKQLETAIDTVLWELETTIADKTELHKRLDQLVILHMELFGTLTLSQPWFKEAA